MGILEKLQISLSMPDTLNPYARFDALEELVKKSNDTKLRGTCLDVGCGNGYASIVFSKYFSEMISLDVSKHNLKSCQLNNLQNVLKTHFILADASMLPLKPSSCDTIFAFSIIEHIKDKNALLSEISRVMAKNGSCIIQFPNEHFPLELHSGFPLPILATQKLLTLYFNYVLKGKGEFPVWNLDRKEAAGLYRKFFNCFHIQPCNYTEECVPPKFQALYRLARQLGILKIFPLCWIATCS
jgi:ubiquinone/menaquinone biosynthesis C-methylase UbiE